MLRYYRRLTSSLVTRLLPDRTGSSARLVSPLEVTLRPEGGAGALLDEGGLRAVLGPCLRDDGGCGGRWGDRARTRPEDEGRRCLSSDSGGGGLKADLGGIGGGLEEDLGGIGGGGVWDNRVRSRLEVDSVGCEVDVGG